MFISEETKKTLGEAPLDNEEATQPAAEPVQDETTNPPVGETQPEAAPVQQPSAAPEITEPATPVPAAEAIPPAQPEVTPTFEQLLAERSGGRFKTVEDALAVAQELENARNVPQGEDVFADETNRLLNHYVKSGKGSLAEGYSLITKDYTTMDAMDVLREYSLLKEPFLTPELREVALQEWADKFDPELNDAKAIQTATIAFKREENRMRSELIQEQSTLLNGIRAELAAEPKPQVAPAIDPAAQQAQMEHWKKMVDVDLLGSVNELEFKQADGSSYKFTVDDNAKSAARNDMYNIDSFSERYKNADGSYDLNRFKSDMVKLNNFDKILSSVISQAKAGSTLGILGEIQNAPIPTPQTPPASGGQATTPADPISQARRQMLGRR